MDLHLVNEESWELVLLTEGHALQEVFVRFGRKSADEVGRDGDARNSTTQNFDDFAEIVARVFASHVAQNGVTSALKIKIGLKNV